MFPFQFIQLLVALLHNTHVLVLYLSRASFLAQVLPAATVAGLALQALTGTPSPPFLDLQPALIPSINMSSSSSGSNGGKESREWWCNNWRLEVRNKRFWQSKIPSC